MASNLLELLTQKYTHLVEDFSQSGNIQYNFQYCQLVKLSPERLEEEIKKCPKRNHTDCLPHLCVKAHFELVREIKREIEIQCFHADKKLLTFTTSDPQPNKFNLYRNALLRMGHSEEYAKQFYTCNPHTDFYIIKDMSMNCVIIIREERITSLIWATTDNTLSREEVKALAEKHKDVLDLFMLGTVRFSILD